MIFIWYRKIREYTWTKRRSYKLTSNHNLNVTGRWEKRLAEGMRARTNSCEAEAPWGWGAGAGETNIVLFPNGQRDLQNPRMQWPLWVLRARGLAGVHSLISGCGFSGLGCSHGLFIMHIFQNLIKSEIQNPLVCSISDKQYSACVSLSVSS